MAVISLVVMLLQVNNIPTPENYSFMFGTTIWGIVMTVVAWLANRSINKADDEIKQLKQTIKEEADKKERERRDFLASIDKINGDIDRLKESTNDRLSEIALRISTDIKDLAVKVAGIRNDGTSK